MEESDGGLVLMRSQQLIRRRGWDTFTLFCSLSLCALKNVSYLSHCAAAPALLSNMFVVSPTFVFPFPLANIHKTSNTCMHVCSDLPPLAVDVSDAVGQ